MLLTLVLVTAAVFPSLILSLALGSIDRPWLPSPSLGPEAPHEPRAVVRGPTRDQLSAVRVSDGPGRAARDRGRPRSEPSERQLLTSKSASTGSSSAASPSVGPPVGGACCSACWAS